jgi:hypothetical protein
MATGERHTIAYRLKDLEQRLDPESLAASHSSLRSPSCRHP